MSSVCCWHLANLKPTLLFLKRLSLSPLPLLIFPISSNLHLPVQQIISSFGSLSKLDDPQLFLLPISHFYFFKSCCLSKTSLHHFGSFPTVTSCSLRSNNIPRFPSRTFPHFNYSAPELSWAFPAQALNAAHPRGKVLESEILFSISSAATGALYVYPAQVF